MKTGDDAPDFTLKDAEQKDWRLSEHLPKTVVLMFYPADNSPVCTKQLCSVRDNWAQFRGTGAEIVGVSTDSVAMHKDFAAKNNFPFALLSDEAGEVVAKYGFKSWLPGRSARGVVVIDRKGKIAYHKVETISLFRPDDADTLAAIRRARSV